MNRVLFILYFIVTTTGSPAQEVAYRQFTVKDGLPGSIVYHCLQDRKGFIWFATNQGVSRFDGRSFHSYTKEDGLPDNDIIKLYLDRHDDIWFISFVGIPAVIHHDSIIRFDRCPKVKAICEDLRTDSIILIAADIGSDRFGLYRSVNLPGRWKFTGEIHPRSAYAQYNVLRASTPDSTNFYFARSRAGRESSVEVRNRRGKTSFSFHTHEINDDPAFTNQSFFSLLPDSQSMVFFTYDSAYYAAGSRLTPLFSSHDLGLNLGFNGYVNNLYCENDTTLWLCARNEGLVCLRNFRTGRRTMSHYFPQSNCTSMLKDREGGYWITTFSDGVFYVPNLSFGALSEPRKLAVASVRSIHALDGHRLVAGFDDGNIMIFDRYTHRYRLFPHWAAHNKNNRIMDILPWRHGLLVSADMGFHHLSLTDTDTLLVHCSHKECILQPDGSVITANSLGLCLLDTNGRLAGYFGSERATCVASMGDNIYWGGHNGISGRLDGHITPLERSTPGLSGVINHIDIAPDTALWISTEDGIVIRRPGLVRYIGKTQGLASNLCKQVSFDGTTAWVATDKGISRIDYHWQDTDLRYGISNITEDDGLRANDVNRTLIEGDIVWAATARGICFFPKAYTGQSSVQPGIVITRILAGDQPVNLTASPIVNYRSGKLLFEIAGISYRSGSHVSYEYRLKETDSAWNRLAGNTLEFPTLPFGRFTLELRSIDRWGGRSSPVTIPIWHPHPFYRTDAFLLSTYAVIVLLTAGGFYLYSRRRQYKRDKELQLRKKMHDLELSALRAQMNPHFIFNCLTSIQYHVLRADTVSANVYLHKFSNLIRATLQHSSLPAISLRDEIRMLTLYLELEKLRLGHRMNYRITPSQPSGMEDLSIPSMIIQPYVENAIQHGIAPLEDRTGEVSVEFSLSPHYLHCTIEDNGPGIRHARRPQPDTDHISLGTGITARRIRTINSIYKQQIKLEVLDKTTAGGSGSGTIVYLSFPLNTD